MSRAGAAPSSLADRGRSLVVRGVASTLPWIMTRSLRQGLAGVYARGATEALRGATVLAPTHHSWWDAYLAWYLAQRAGAPLAALMDDAQLRRFPFFRHHGAIEASHPRELVRRVRRGALGVVFPEGRIRVPGPPGPLQPGAVRLAAWSRAPLRAVALRVTLRGLQHPEAFVQIGPVVTSDDELRDALAREVADLDAFIAACDPERVPTGVEVWLHGAASPDRRATPFERLWSERA
jgi:1-acyl-sn-glycerol-3-phosphate acyltransferase